MIKVGSASNNFLIKFKNLAGQEERNKVTAIDPAAASLMQGEEGLTDQLHVSDLFELA